MKAFIIFITCFFIFTGSAEAVGRRHRYDGNPKTEVELMTKVLDCLRSKDTVGYYHLFPPFDSLWKMVIHNPDQSAETQKELAKLKEKPTVFIDLDPFYNHAIINRFVETLKKGEDSGIQWYGIVTQRYELQKQEITRGLEGLQHIIPERFRGYLFVRDMMSSTTYCITIAEIQKVNGYYCGGQVLNVLEASNVDQYLKKERAERAYLAKLLKMEQERKNDSAKADTAGIMLVADSTATDTSKNALAKATANPTDTTKTKKDLLLSANSLDDDVTRQRREVVDRKYYLGKFDDEIPVELYVRYMKDVGGKVTKYWDALYKFGDMAEYVKLDVSKTDEKWLFEEPVGSMELELNGKTYSGSWTNGGTQTGYDAELLQGPISQKKIMELDLILENGLWGKTNEQKISEDDERGGNSKKDKKKKKKKEEEEENLRAEKEKAASAKKEKETQKTDTKQEKTKDTEKDETKPEKAPRKEDEEKDEN